MDQSVAVGDVLDGPLTDSESTMVEDQLVVPTISESATIDGQPAVPTISYKDQGKSPGMSSLNCSS